MTNFVCLGLVDDSIDLDSFFKEYSKYLEGFNKSFSSKGFPEVTLAEIDVLLSYQKSSFKNVIIHDQNMRTEAQDFIIDMESKLIGFKTALQTGNLAVAAQRKDFVSAKSTLSKNYFAQVKKDFSDSSLANLKSFQRVLWLLGA